MQFTATASPGYRLNGWSGALSGTPPTGTIVMNGPRSVSAAFVAEQTVPVTLLSNAPGTTVTMNGNPVALPATVNLIPGQIYRFAAPGSVDESGVIRWVFQRWNIPGSNVVDYLATSSPATLSVTFQRNVFITTTANPSAGGTVTGGGWHLSAGRVPITATPSRQQRMGDHHLLVPAV